MRLKGIGAAPGICRARVYFYEKKENRAARISFDEALVRSLERVKTLYKKALSSLDDEQAKIFAAYEMLLEDEMLTAPMKEKIKGGADSLEAVRSVTSQMSALFLGKDNEYMRQRGDDIRYVGELLCDALCGNDGAFFSGGGEKIILMARELTPVDTMAFDTNVLAALVTEMGGATSHTVILAKSLGIPAIVGTEKIDPASGGKICCVDGYTGEVVIEPDEENEKIFAKKLEEEKAFAREIEKITSADAVTADGKKIGVYINIGHPNDINIPKELRYDGVGLFRSEFLYSSQVKKPTVGEQKESYGKVIDAVHPAPVTIRTLDIGGDKQLDYLDMKPEENPFLGNRGIRLCKNNVEIFAEQLEAILTSSLCSVKIMLPMITSPAEIDWARDMLESIRKRLINGGQSVCESVSLGIMIETPASAVMADILAKKCDFFSIGTNDLVQYITAADRGNADVEEIYNPYSPAVVRLLCNVIQAANDAGIEVSVCGDLAADTAFTSLLLGMGLRKLSVPVPMVGRIKHKIAQISIKEAQKLAMRALAAENAEDVERILKEK